jgi:hypothetical protein
MESPSQRPQVGVVERIKSTGFLSFMPETSEHRVARMERWLAMGWLRFSVAFTCCVTLSMSILCALIFGFLAGYSFPFRLVILIPPMLPVNLVLGQIIWLAMPPALERLRETDLARKALFREAFFFAFVGPICALSASLLPLHLGRSSAVPDLMLTISGLVITGWGVMKMHRYWTTASGWCERGFGNRFVRLYAYDLALVFLLLLCLARAYAYYGDAAWAAPIRNLIY